MKRQSTEVADLVKNLPMKLRLGLQVEVLELALTDEIITISAEGHWQWHLGSSTLLAYFCGRMWCGDMPCRRARSKMICWVPGKRRFPTTNLHALFDASNLDVLRRNRKFTALPEGYELIDNLFVEIANRTQVEHHRNTFFPPIQDK